MSKFVLDASAVLALLYSEAGMEKVESSLADAVIARVNATEVLTKLVERGNSVEQAIEDLSDLRIPILELNESQSHKIAELRPMTKHLGLSLGDRACLALAIQENATAITADRNWLRLDVCPIESIR